MKTLLAIALVAAALTIGTAAVGPISGTAVAGGGGPDSGAGQPSAYGSGAHGAYQAPPGSHQTPSGSYRGQR